MPPDHREIIAGWNRFVSGEFILERHLKRGSVFITLEDEQVYMVGGIFSSWEEMIPQADLPILLRATLIPFRDKIIYDSIVTCSNVILGRGYAETFKNIYLLAKQAKPFTPRFDRSEYFDRAHVRGLGFLVGDAGVFGGYHFSAKNFDTEKSP